MKHTLSVLVDNKPGVLARITSLCSRRGFNIHSLAVGPIHEPGRSRVTLVVDGDQMEAVTKQLNKLVNVIKVTEFYPEDAVEREIMLCRVNTSADRRREVLDTAGAFDATPVDVTVDSVTFEVTGKPRKLASFLEVMRPFGVTDLVKSGRIALSRNGKAEHDGFESPRRKP
jgi:acetolactate synthase-1/3 small subunit